MAEDPTAGGRRPDPAVLTLAEQALDAAKRGDASASVIAVNRLADLGQGVALSDALTFWCDQYALHITDGIAARQRPAHVTNVGLINPANGAVARPGDPRLGPVGEWIGKTIRARVAMDRTAWAASMKELVAASCTDPALAGKLVLSLLRSVAATINGTPRGFGVIWMHPCHTCGSRDAKITPDRVRLCNVCGSTAPLDGPR